MVLFPRDSVYKTKSNIEELRAPVIALTTEGNADIRRLAEDVIEIENAKCSRRFSR